MDIKVKINGLLAWLFGASGKSEYEVDISPASKRQGDLMRKLGPCTEEKQKEEFERYAPDHEFTENKIRNDTARSIRGRMKLKTVIEAIKTGFRYLKSKIWKFRG